jgi:hypothetical protein
MRNGNGSVFVTSSLGGINKKPLLARLISRSSQPSYYAAVVLQKMSEPAHDFCAGKMMF